MSDKAPEQATTSPKAEDQPKPALVIEKNAGWIFGVFSVRIENLGLAAAAVTGVVMLLTFYIVSRVTESPLAIVGAGLGAAAMTLLAFYLAQKGKEGSKKKE